MKSTRTESIENMADRQSNDLAKVLCEAFEGSFEKLSELEDTVSFLYDLLDSAQLFDVLETLHDALDCPMTETEDLFADDDVLDFFTMCYVFSLSEAILEIGMADISKDAS